VDQEDQGDHNPPWWTRTGFHILLMRVLGPKGGEGGEGLRESCRGWVGVRGEAGHSEGG